MFGFGIILMYLSEYFAKRKYDKRDKETRIAKPKALVQGNQITACFNMD